MPTIIAPATPPGNGGIGILRLSGPGAKNLLGRVFLPHSAGFKNFKPWVLHRGMLLDRRDQPLDDVLAVYMPGPKTYTGEDTAEIHCHGGQLLLQEALESLLRLGCRLAEPGEFTKRAYINGRIDLTQAEAVAELISAPSRTALAHGLGRLEGRLAVRINVLRRNLDELRALAKLGLDFPDDEIEGLDGEAFQTRIEEIIKGIDDLLAGTARARLHSDGATIALVGAVNAGKSSILNALYGNNRALVSELPGTTRDFIEVQLNLGGLPVRLIDTAGLRTQATDPVENMGMSQSIEILKSADLAAIVLDASLRDQPMPPGLAISDPARTMIIWNKIDLREDPLIPEWAMELPSIKVSALIGTNMDALPAKFAELLLAPMPKEKPDSYVPPNQRQTVCLEKARLELLSLLTVIQDIPYDCWLAHLDLASSHLDRILGLADNDELLDMIFSKFCIGK